MAVQKCAVDSVPFVRKIAAHALLKLYHYDPSQEESVLPILKSFLREMNPLVFSSAIIAYSEDLSHALRAAERLLPPAAGAAAAAGRRRAGGESERADEVRAHAVPPAHGEGPRRAGGGGGGARGAGAGGGAGDEEEARREAGQ